MNPQLSNQIDTLLRTEVGEDDDAAAVAQFQKMFSAHGVLSIKQVGAQAAAEYVVLLVNDQPLSFMEQALPLVKKASDAHDISPNSYVYFQTSIQQKRVESSLGKPTNPELQDQIEKLSKIDQAVRQKDNFDPKKMIETDEQTRAAVRSILDRYGMPTLAMVGPDAATDFVIMIQHQPADFREKALPKLKQNVDVGQASAKDYAMVYDRAQTDQGKQELYGVNLVCQPDGTLSPGHIIDAAHVNDRRAALGLMPLEIYMSLSAVVAPPDFCKTIQHPATK